MKQLNVLMIDDDCDWCSDMWQTRFKELDGWDINFVACADKASAEAELAKGNIDCIFMDYSLKQDDPLGDELTAFVRAQEKNYNKAPIFIMAWSDSTTDVEVADSFFRNGANMVSKKMIVQEQLLIILNTVFEFKEEYAKRKK